MQIELLREILASLTDKTAFPGISRLLVDWEYQRERLQRNVVKAVDRLQRKGHSEKDANEAKRMLVKAESHEVQVQSPESFARAEARDSHASGTVACAAGLSWPARRSAKPSCHADRRQALRYTLEIVRPIYSDRLDAVLEAIKQVQTLLGEVHDCDVWQEQLDQFAKTQRNRIKSHYGHAGPFSRLNRGHRVFAARSPPAPSSNASRTWCGCGTN